MITDDHGLLLFSKTAPWPWEVGFIVLMGMGLITLMLCLQIVVDDRFAGHTRLMMALLFLATIAGLGVCLGLWLTS